MKCWNKVFHGAFISTNETDFKLFHHTKRSKKNSIEIVKNSSAIFFRFSDEKT